MKNDLRFNTNLKSIRKSKGITQIALAKELGIPYQTINRYENTDIKMSKDLEFHLKHQIEFMHRVATSKPVEKLTEEELEDIYASALRLVIAFEDNEEDCVKPTKQDVELQRAYERYKESKVW